MSDAPERLGRYAYSELNVRYAEPPAYISGATEYVRADLFDALTEERDRLKDQRDYYKARDEEGERIQAEIEAERDRLAKANAELLASLASVLQACDEGRMVERGAGGMTIDAQIRRSVINGVPAWPIEEARALLDKHKATSTEREGE